MKGIITEIQRFSLHDGPGIRTTVFLKGCNLRCIWCHNPETISRNRELLYYDTKCIRCMECFNACPNSAHVLIGEKHKIIREQCSNCGTCTSICPGGALIMIGEEKSHREIIKEILLDYPYYKNSAGGITISGGEPLAQVNFTRAILKAAQKKHIHTAIESNLAFNWETVFRVVPYTDLIITDIKLFDTKKHKLHTNSFNDSILRNIKNLSNIGKDTTAGL